MLRIVILFYLLLLCTVAIAEEVSIEVHTDNWGYEIYWELSDASNDCGEEPIFVGGNTNVGCEGGGGQQQSAGGYPNNSTISEGPWDLELGGSYKVIFIDDWGDGGAIFDIQIGGYTVYSFEATGAEDEFIFDVVELPNLDVGIHELTMGPYLNQGEVEVQGHVLNSGLESINSLTLAFWVGNEEWIVGSLNDLSIAPFEEYTFVHPILWGAWSPGSYELSVQILEVNGLTGDENPMNDMQNIDLTVLDIQPNILPSYFLDTESVEIEVIADNTDQVDHPRDLDFHPGGDLWIINQGTENTGGSTVKITDPGSQNQNSLWQQDGNAWHFMSLPSAIAFGLNTNFATSTAVFDANHDGGEPFTGPALWSSDPDIYAQPSGGNGSHLDMLHESPYSMGIAWERDNIYWVFDHFNGDIARYDFAEDHGPGNSDHADGIIWRFPEVEVSWIEQGISCHIEFDEDKEDLYIVDGGQGRVLRLNSASGNLSGVPSWGPHESLAEYANVTGVEWDVVVQEGLIEPSGIEILDGYMVVSDHANGDVIFFDISELPANEIGRVSTGAPGIQGIVIGPDGFLWYVNSITNEVGRLIPDSVILNTTEASETIVEVFPNPASEFFSVRIDKQFEHGYINLYSASGEIVHTEKLNGSDRFTILTHQLPRGVYVLEVGGSEFLINKRLIIQ
ncbi:T9SS type A sorting domain-containing protein [Sanyastnella coralliicola]|uniref:T9SS type A sorting domain-containing protein n=1 Tax=Sanyastnella coralliicola TaxID=3069118 RepID=UPI0027BAA281|nr:T9SS type A sorting domain-containing protein [Longitalea sp. SCSIO 12813]